MTDDFHLFGDPGDGDRPIDPDLALISAYLARELSPMQVLALEERLARDPAFRAAMQPLLDAWAAPIPSLGNGAARRDSALSALEREESWRRFLRETPAAGSISQAKPRRSSMKRAAAVIALVVVPMASFAQVVVDAANNPDARGHEIARRIVAPFVRETPPPKRDANVSEGTQGSPGVPRLREVDSGSLLPMPMAPIVPLESESMSPRAPSAARATPTPGAMTIQGAPLEVQAQVRQPDRARITALVREHQPDVMNGSAKAEYVVMVLDAAERYVWSTFGSGNVMTEVAGDTRSVDERNAYFRDHRAEFWGDTLALTGFGFRGTATGVAAGRARSGGGGGRVATARGSATLTADTLLVDGRRAIVSGTRIMLDSAVPRQATGVAVAGGVWVGRAGAGVDTGSVRVIDGMAIAARGERRGSGTVGEAYGTISSSSGASTYQYGYMSTRNAPAGNEAPGLVPLEDGSSGIQGLPSASVAGAETYHFRPGELAPSLLRIIVVRLTPGAVWTPR